MKNLEEIFQKVKQKDKKMQNRKKRKENQKSPVGQKAR